MRVCLTVGPWQSIVLECALRMHSSSSAVSRELLYFNAQGADERLYQGVVQVSESLRGWADVAWLYGSLLDLRDDAGASVLSDRGSVTELWLPKFGAEERRFAALFPRAKVFVYEDGAYVYSQGGVRGYRGLKWKSKVMSCFWNCIPSAIVRRFYRCEAYYGFLNEALALPSYYKGFDSCVIDAAHLDSVSEQLLSSSNEMPVELCDEKSVVFVGQCFSLLSIMSREGELALYHTAIRRILDEGGRVLWKEHPRNAEGFYQELEHRLGSRNFQNFNDVYQSSLPFDVLVRQMKLKGIVSISSTALLMGKYVHSLPVARVAAELSAECGTVARDLEALVEAHIPNL